LHSFLPHVHRFLLLKNLQEIRQAIVKEQA